MECSHAVVADGVDHVVHELLRRDVDNLHARKFVADAPPDGVHQMRLPHADTGVEIQRVVSVSRIVRDRPRGGVSKLIARPDDEFVE